MKTYEIDYPIHLSDLLESLKNTLPAKFSDKIKGNHELNVSEDSDTIGVGIPSLYDDFLYQIRVDGNKVSIAKSEHYTDDVNSLALEDILTSEVVGFIGEEHIVQIIPSVN